VALVVTEPRVTTPSTRTTARSHTTSTLNTTYDDPTARGDAVAHADARALLGQVMGYVALAGLDDAQRVSFKTSLKDPGMEPTVDRKRGLEIALATRSPASRFVNDDFRYYLPDGSQCTATGPGG
jgi:hypothetical protein